ncbi:MAG: hypothetical protein AB1644_00525 [Candidatus Zixiibacteriota bacterium]
MKHIATIVMLAVFAVISCKEKTPNRDYIPVLKQQLYLLQEAVKAGDRTVLDSLLSDDLRAENGADSLFWFVSAPGGEFAFAQFGNCEIYYNDDKARADCVLVDTAGREGAAVTLTMVNEGGKWLLKRFESKTPAPGR